MSRQRVVGSNERRVWQSFEFYPPIRHGTRMACPWRPCIWRVRETLVRERECTQVDLIMQQEPERMLAARVLLGLE
ncbi:MAG: hypothetical protein L0H73_16005 [Nitrococcus sp.]|nr:hypothetical protein [Nitrococcus sp.]